MTSLRWLAIANPAAGRRDSALQVAESLLRAGAVQAIAVSRAPGDAARTAREALDVDGVVSVGGDGTTYEILAGLDRARHLLALMPVGHGNCLARDLGIGHADSAREALTLAHAKSLRALDLMDVTLHHVKGEATRRLGACTFAAGYVAETVATGRFRLPRLGLAAYAVASTVTVPRRLRATLALDALEVEITDCTGVIVNNTAHLANFRAFPDARLDDARLDIMGLGAGWARQVAHNACILAGASLVRPALFRQAASVRLTFDAPTVVMLDGELIDGVTAVELGVLRGAVRCVGRP